MYQSKNKFSGLYYPPFSFKPKEGKIYVTDLNVSPVKLLETKIVADHDLKLNLHGLDLIEVRYFIRRQPRSLNIFEKIVSIKKLYF